MVKLIHTARNADTGKIVTVYYDTLSKDYEVRPDPYDPYSWYKEDTQKDAIFEAEKAVGNNPLPLIHVQYLARMP